MEKQITFTQIRAVYTKDFDTFGKMDPFLEFSVGKEKAKTETITDGGKEPKWKETITLKFYEDQTTIIIKAHEEDVTSNDYMGQGKIDIKNLKDAGDLEVKILQQDGKQSGTVYCKYVLKTLAPVPMLVVKNIKCDFYKDTELIIKSKPFLTVASNSLSTSTEAKEKGERKLAWNETLKIKIAQNQKITFSMEDKVDITNKIFVYDAFPKEFKTLNGTKKFNVMDSSFEPLGLFEFSYETLNFVNKEESLKNQQATKKSSNQLTQLRVESIKGNLNSTANDLYFKMTIGPNTTKTIMLDKAAKDFTMEVKKTIYADKMENKLVISAYNQNNIGGDTLYGFGELLLDSTIEGKNTVKLADRKNVHFGDIIIEVSKKSVILREITLDDLKVKLGVSADIIGDSDVYLVATIGGWVTRTETLSGKDLSYSKSLVLKYSDEKKIQIDIIDEDITKDDAMYKLEVNLEDFKDEGGEMTLPLIPEQYKDDKSKHGTFSFKYKSKNSIQKPKPKEEPKKEQPKKQQPKKQQKPVEEPKKQQKPPSEKKIKAAQPQKQPLKEQPKKEQKKPQQKKPIANMMKLEQSVLKQKPLDKSRHSEKDKMEKSRNTIKLPDINDPKNWGDKIYEKQSSSTLQKSIVAYSLPKAHRFANGPKYTGEPTFVIDTSFKANSTKGAGFGFGNKRQFPDWMERNMKQNPAPGSYFDHPASAMEFRTKGPTFGLPYKYYQKVMIPRQKTMYPKAERKSPERISNKRS